MRRGERIKFRVIKEHKNHDNENIGHKNHHGIKSSWAKKIERSERRKELVSLLEFSIFFEHVLWKKKEIDWIPQCWHIWERELINDFLTTFKRFQNNIEMNEKRKRKVDIKEIVLKSLPCSPNAHTESVSNRRAQLFSYYEWQCNKITRWHKRLQIRSVYSRLDEVKMLSPHSDN